MKIIRNCGLSVLLLLFLGISIGSAHNVKNVSKNIDSSVIDTTQVCDTVIEKTKMEIADSLFALYETRVSQNEMSDSIYKSLNECTSVYFDVFNDTTFAESFPQIKIKLLSLHDKLQEGGVYYSQRGNNVMATELLEKYILLPKHDYFQDANITLAPNYPMLVFYVAQNKYNVKDFSASAILFDEYLKSKNKDFEQKAYLFLGKSYGYIGRDEQQIFTLMKGLEKYPKDIDILKEIVEYHIKTNSASQANLYLMNYESLGGNQNDLLSMKARIAEVSGDFMSALLLSERLHTMNEGNVNNMSLYGRSAYNFVINEMKNGKVDAHNKPLPELNSYLEIAADMFSRIVKITSDKVYYDALIDTYLLLDRKDEAVAIADKLGRTLKTHDEVPQALLSEEKKAQPKKEEEDPLYSRVETEKQKEEAPLVTAAGVPLFHYFANDYVEKRLKPWFVKGTFEKTIDYEKRTSGESLIAKKRELVNEAKQAYLRKYVSTVASRVGGIENKGYDADNETFYLTYNLGYMVVNVPIKDAAIMDANWGFIKLTDPKFEVVGDSIVLSELSFSLPDAGLTYTYSRNERNKYEEKDFIVENVLGDNGLDDILGINKGNEKGNASTVTHSETIIGSNRVSDIDMGIPLLPDSLTNNNQYTFVLIISNENYDWADRVHYALADGMSFKEYCLKVLGVPKKNIKDVVDVSSITMEMQIEKFVSLLREYGSQARGIVYYSGHGVPNMVTQEAYFLAKDGYPTSLKGTISIKNLYDQLATTGASRIDVFLDCCFSGNTKGGNAIVQNRATAIKPKENTLNGNIVVFSACSGDETAFHYAEQGHGLFTYFLLKKLKETGGDVTMGELQDYIYKNVRRTSLHNNDVYQTPNVNYSESMSLEWKNMKMR